MVASLIFICNDYTQLVKEYFINYFKNTNNANLIIFNGELYMKSTLVKFLLVSSTFLSMTLAFAYPTAPQNNHQVLENGDLLVTSSDLLWPTGTKFYALLDVTVKGAKFLKLNATANLTHDVRSNQAFATIKITNNSSTNQNCVISWNDLLYGNSEVLIKLNGVNDSNVTLDAHETKTVETNVPFSIDSKTQKPRIEDGTYKTMPISIASVDVSCEIQ